MRSEKRVGEAEEESRERAGWPSSGRTTHRGAGSGFVTKALSSDADFFVTTGTAAAANSTEDTGCASSLVLAGGSITVAVETEVIWPDDGDESGVLGTIAASSFAVIVGGPGIKAIPLVRRVAVGHGLRRLFRLGQRSWPRRRERSGGIEGTLSTILAMSPSLARQP